MYTYTKENGVAELMNRRHSVVPTKKNKQKNIQNQFQRNKLEVVKILHTGEANRKTSVLCHLIEIAMTFHLLESNIHLLL